MGEVVMVPGAGSQVPLAVFEAARALLTVDGPVEARLIARALVRGLGGECVPAPGDRGDVIPVDISFGSGDPELPTARAGSAERVLLDRYIAPFLLDARIALERAGRAERLAEAASTDVLTGLPNRRMIDRALGRLSGQDTVIILDLDHFKNVNDTYGHARGDDVLRAFAATLIATIRGRDLVGRFGGEEFVVILGPPVGAEAVLERVRDAWATRRPLAVSFSAGIARSVGDADQTVAMADRALYRAKAEGRNRWYWADEPVPAPRQAPRDLVGDYLADALPGRRRPAVRQALDLLDRRMPPDQIVEDLLAVAQREVGERWHRNELSPADEHLASGVAVAVLDALNQEVEAVAGQGLTLVTCAEGDWHSLAAQMFSEALRTLGLGVLNLGSSVPAEAVGEFLSRSGVDSLAVSCGLPMFFPGVVRLVDAAHLKGIPVIVGGRAFGADPTRAAQLGADAWARTADEAAAILVGWRSTPPMVDRRPRPLDAGVLRILGAAESIAQTAAGNLEQRLARASGSQAGHQREAWEDMLLTIRLLAAAMLVDEDAVFFEHLTWLRTLRANRGQPVQALVDQLETMMPAVAAVNAAGCRLLTAGRDQMLTM